MTAARGLRAAWDRWRPPLYPAVIALAYVSVFVLGTGIHVAGGLRAIGLTVAVVLLVTLVAGRLMGDRERGAAVALVLVLAAVTGPDPVLPLLALSIVALLVVERLASRDAERMAARWALVGRVLTAVGVIAILAVGIKAVQDGAVPRIVAELLPAGGPAVTAAADDPDIYLLMLDGYLRPDKQAELFGNDPREFVAGLRLRGFEVAERSRSNYLLTSQSLPSLLNAAHVGDLMAEIPIPGGQDGRRPWIRERIDRGRVVAALRERGYEVISLPGGFEEATMRGADRVVDGPHPNEFEIAMLRESSLGSLMEGLAPRFFVDQHRARVEGQFRRLMELAREPVGRPRFVFAHVPSPHAPLVFAADGSRLPPRPLEGFFDDTAVGYGLSREAYGERYIGQLTYLNGLVLDALDEILAAANRPGARPAVVLVVSDHGSGSGTDWSDIANSDLDERTANLIAWRAPGHADVLGSSPTLVNVLGQVVNAHLGTAFPMQPDSIFVPDDSFWDLRQIPNPDEVGGR